MTNTVNFTISVDKALLKRAKILAAQTDTSVNALFNAELRYLVETFESAASQSNQNYRSLLDFSLGEPMLNAPWKFWELTAKKISFC